VAHKNRSDLASLAAIMLAVGFLRHYGWDVFPEEHQGAASKGLGGVAMAYLIFLVAGMARDRWVWLVSAWWIWENLQVAICSFWFIASPWHIEPGQAMCSAKLGFDLGAVGMLIVAVMMWRLQGLVGRKEEGAGENGRV